VIGTLKKPWVVVAILVVVVGGFYAWQAWKPSALPKGIVGSNGRIEAVEVDIATKIPGRVKNILVHEGDYVHAGQELATMDTATLNAQLNQAKAELERARIAVRTANDLVTQRGAEKAAAEAVVAQRQAQLDAASKRLKRTSGLATKGTVSAQTADDDKATYQGAKAGVSAAKAQVAAADAALGYAQSNVVSAQAGVEAAEATVARIKADIDDGTLRAPRDGRVQYRVAEPGEILAAGGVVLNLVDLTDVYMTFYLPTASAGRVALGSEARIVLDAAPQYVIPAKISFVADVAQFTPKTVETAEERQKLMFRIKARIPADVLRKYIRTVKTGLPGMAYVRVESKAQWPANLEVRLPK
jgi:HlyD family secretion protein